MQDFTNYNPNAYKPPYEAAASRAASSEAVFFQRVYAWMFLGLAVTAAVAFVLSRTPAWVNFLYSSQFVILGACGLQLGMVLYLSARIQQLAPSTAKAFFLGYSAVTGATFSVFLLIYPTAAIAKAFVCTAGVYGAMALFGLVTRRSLQAWGSFLMMGVVGLLVASLVNIFMRSASMDWVICVIGVLVFSGLTAYYHQALRVIHATALRDAGESEVNQAVIMGALTLYLAFINLFLFLLRLFGSSRD